MHSLFASRYVTSITTNCAPLLNINANDFLEDCDPYPSLPINDKPSYEVLNVNRINNCIDSVDNSPPPENAQDSATAVNHVILLKTAKAVAVVNDKKLHANILLMKVLNAVTYVQNLPINWV